MSHFGERADLATARYLSAIVESSTDAIIGKSLEGIVTSWSRGAERIYGYSADEIVGQSISVLIPDDLQHELPAIIDRLAAGERIDLYTTRRVHKQGHELDVSLTITPVAGGDGKTIGAATIARDITEQRRTEAALRYRVAFEDLVASISTDFVNLDPDETDAGINEALGTIGTFADVDRSYVYQFSPDLQAMASTHEWCAEGIEPSGGRFHNAPLSAMPNFTSQILRNEVVYVPSTDALPAEFVAEAAELRYQKIKSLVLVPLVSRGVPLGFLGFDSLRVARSWSDEIIRLLTFVGQIFVNALERRRAAYELREREMQYRHIFEATSDGLIITDPETGIVLEANPAMCRMHGYTYEEFVGLHRTAFIHPEYYGLLKDYVGTIMDGGEYRVRAMDVRKDGSFVHVEVNGALLHFRGKPAILGVVRDITNDMEAYEILERRVEQRTQELSALLEISSNVASTLELDALLELILDQLTLVIEHTGSAILTLEGDTLLMVAFRSWVANDGPRRTVFPIGEVTGIWERLQHGESVVIPDLWGDSEDAATFRQYFTGVYAERFSRIRSFLLCGLIVKGEAIGILSMTHVEPNAFSRRDATLAAAVARHAAIAIENARLFEQAQGKAALEERQKLARELHDSVSQALYGIALGAQTAKTLLERDPPQAAAPVDYVLSLAEVGLAEMRALIFELRPESLATEGLVAALNKQTAALSARYQIQITMDFTEEPDLPLEVKEVLYRIAQEAMHNTVKHAKASSICVHLACSGDSVVLELTDDGIGFDAGQSFPGHLGLQSMRERTGRLGGQIGIDSAPGQGTRVHTFIPLAQTTDAGHA